MNLDNPRARQPPRMPWTIARLQFERAIAIGASIDQSSALAYTSALQSYIAFCRMHQLPIEPTPDTLSFYIVYMSHHIKPSLVNSYLSGICSQLEPFFPTICQARTTTIVCHTLQGCLKLYSSPTQRKRPLHRSELLHIAPYFTPTSTFDQHLWWALLLTAFYGLLHLGELVMPDNAQLRDDRKLIRRLLVSLQPTAFTFLLLTHKADRFFEDNDVAGHSICSGGATYLAELGVDLNLIQSIGRWSSNAFRVYIRTHPVMLAAVLNSNSSHTPQV
ncbi:hypothetical protein FISHEDRAFT_49739 [Fistulina hepatica ATCC 64428]|uniref:Uncharacterized protein n=1 Tax=Fistulina hepatica ATCC 64428 TaxID=1128425 RepID=A0A0D7A2S5_9AGAR|nr:hypothetical protein FISHEDRAFT_49739 [Fistulina hepatica ATCC 64428]